MPYKDAGKLKSYKRQWAQKNPDSNKNAVLAYRKTAKYQEALKKRYQSPEYKKLTKYGSLRRKYGLTPEAYQALLESQNYRCAICGDTNGRGTERLAVDHDHKTGKIRGLLCYKCNVSLGFVGENIGILNKMINYINNHNA